MECVSYSKALKFPQVSYIYVVIYRCLNRDQNHNQKNMHNFKYILNNLHVYIFPQCHKLLCFHVLCCLYVSVFAMFS